jgi:mRNA interferase RelE/StbE
MKYRVVVSKVAVDDLEELPTNLFDRITRRIHAFQDGLPGSVKKLREFGFGYRLRVGDYRVLFDLKGHEITVQAVRHRRHAYSSEPGRKKRKGQH